MTDAEPRKIPDNNPDFTKLLQDLADRDRTVRRQGQRLETLEAENAMLVEQRDEALAEIARLMNDLARAAQAGIPLTDGSDRPRQGTGRRP